MRRLGISMVALAAALMLTGCRPKCEPGKTAIYGVWVTRQKQVIATYTCIPNRHGKGGENPGGEPSDLTPHPHRSGNKPPGLEEKPKR